MSTTLERALLPLPDDSPFRAALTALVSTDPLQRQAAQGALSQLRRPYWEPPLVQSEAVALPVLDAVLDLDFPRPLTRFDRGAADVVITLVGSAHPAVVERVARRYADAPAAWRVDLLTLVASSGTRRGAEVLADAIARHGWPDGLHARFVTEVGKLLPHADAVLPTLLVTPGGPSIELLDLVLRALRTASLAPDVIASTPLVRGLAEELGYLLEDVEVIRGRPDEQLTDDDRNIARELAALLDLAGYVGSADVLALVRRATELPEAWPAAFALASLLRRGEEVDDAAIARVAADPSVLHVFHGLLRDLGAERRIPEERRSRDAFAAADVVRWLAHPGELGRPPAALERMAVFAGARDEGESVVYVWRFHAGDGAWKAAISGPYPADAPEGPLAGESTFSRFEEWSAHDAEGHAHAILATLARWRRTR